MKKLVYAFAALAALLSAASCEREISNPEDLSSTGKYVVKFIAVAPETKTTMNIDGNGVASFTWNDADLENDWEVHQGDKTAKDVVAERDKDGALVITAEFEGTPSGSNYQAVMNGIINDEQVLSSSYYDTTSEVLIGKATAEPGDLLDVPFVFKRMSVVHKITLKGLAEGDVINNVVLTSDEGHALTSGCYYDGAWDSDFDGETITFNGGTITANSDGHATFYAITAPLDAATLSVVATTNTGKVYRKTFGGKLTLAEGDIAEYGVGLVKDADFETYNFANFTSGQDVELSATTFSITLHKGTGSNNPAWVSEEARVYAKGSVVVTSDRDIKKVVYNYTVNANNKGNAPTVDGATGSTDDGTWNAETKTWTGSDKTVTLSTSGSAGNLGFKSITVYYVEGGSDPEPTTYTVTVANDIANGTVTANPTSAAEGATISLTATPADGYEFGSWTVTNATTSAAITVNDNQFTMPAANVNVSATFNETQGGGSTPDPITLSYSNFSNTSYSASELTFTDEGVTYGYVNVMKNGNNGTPQGWAKEQIIQCKASSTFYNKTERKISSIRVYLAINTNAFTISYGTTSECNGGSITRPTTSNGTETVSYTTYAKGGVTGTDNTTLNYYDFDLNSSNASYFKLTTGSGTIYINRIVIQYAE